MNRVIVDEATRAALSHLTEPAELCDESGCVLGRFTPAVDRSLYEGVEPPISEEELRRREQETETYTTDEVLRRLEKL